MTDEEIEKAMQCCVIGLCNECPLDGVMGCQHKLGNEKSSYINRLKAKIKRLREENEDMYMQNHNLQIYIDNHEEIWARNAEIDKAIVRKETVKEVLEIIGQRILDKGEFDSEDFCLMRKTYGFEVVE